MVLLIILDVGSSIKPGRSTLPQTEMMYGTLNWLETTPTSSPSEVLFPEQSRCPKPGTETQNSKPRTRNLELRTQNSKPLFSNQWISLRPSVSQGYSIAFVAVKNFRIFACRNGQCYENVAFGNLSGALLLIVDIVVVKLCSRVLWRVFVGRHYEE